MLKDFSTGIWSYLAVLSQFKHKAVRWLMIFISLASVLWAFGVFQLSFFIVQKGLLWGISQMSWLDGYVFEVITEIVTFLVSFLMSIFLYRYTLYVILSPLLSQLSYLVEKQLYRDKGFSSIEGNQAGIWASFVRAFRLNVRNFIVELAWLIPLFFLSLLPVVGIIGVVGLFLVQAWYAGYANLDFIMERHLNYKESKVYVKRYRGVVLGNGLVFISLMIIPFIGWFVAPLWSVMAATRSYVRNQQIPE